MLYPVRRMLILVFTVFEAANTLADSETTEISADKCVGSNTLCNINDNVSMICQETQFYDPERGQCLKLAGEICQDAPDCISNSSCKPQMNTSLGKFVKKCTCLTNYFKSEIGLCNAHSKYGEFCDSFQPCETNTPLMSCIDNICSCSNGTTQVYDPFKKTCVLRLGENCYEYRSLHHSVCVTNAHCPHHFKPNPPPTKCLCSPGYVVTNSSEGQSCSASFGQSCNETSVCNTGLVCTDGRCQCDSPLHQVFEAGNCRSTLGFKCDASMLCVSNAICDETTSSCKCRNGYTSTLHGPKICKLGYGSQCSPGRASQAQCNHDRGMVCKSNTCDCYDSTLQYRTSTGICSNDVGQVCGAVQVRNNLIRLRGIGKIEYNSNQNYVTIGCQKDLICGKVQGQDACTCLNIESVKSDRAFKIEFCLPSFYY